MHHLKVWKFEKSLFFNILFLWLIESSYFVVLSMTKIFWIEAGQTIRNEVDFQRFMIERMLCVAKSELSFIFVLNPWRPFFHHDKGAELTGQLRLNDK